MTQLFNANEIPGATVHLVGGAVRDSLMGLPVHDRDFVVTGAQPEQLRALKFSPVGKDFPVFLHPDTKEEYALARTERKSGHGYHGFSMYFAPDVTLVEDLARRDLTINAMAMTADGDLIDPYNGKADIEAGILRHVGPAFSEDPVRILRIARFSARYGFAIATETMDLMRSMVSAGEVDHLVAERVWQEFAKGLMEKKPSRMIQVLRDCGALARILPELDCLYGIPQPVDHHPEGDVSTHVLMALDQAAHQEMALEVRFAVLMHDLGKGVTPADQWPAHHKHEALGVPLVKAVADRLRVPSSCRELAMLVAQHHTDAHRCVTLSNGTLVKLLTTLDAFRRPDRLRLFLDACQCDAQGRLGMQDLPYAPAHRILAAHAMVSSIDLRSIAAKAKSKSVIPDLIHQARVRALNAKAKIAA